MGDSLLYPPTLKLQLPYAHFRGFVILFRVARINPVSIFPEDIKSINLTSNEKDGNVDMTAFCQYRH